jgi:hypothetical protein
MNDKTKWGWRHGAYVEKASGPFPSRQAAIDDARERIDGPTIIKVGVIEYPTFEKWIDSNWLIEHADEVCGENDFAFYDDVIFEPKGDEKQADIELKSFLREWAKKYVCTSGCWVMGGDNPEEDVKIDAQASGRRKEGR